MECLLKSIDINTIIDIIVMITTVAAVFVALFGDYWKSKIYGPRLKISLPEPKGQMNETIDGDIRNYYHLKIENKGKLQAKNVIVLLLKVEEEWQGGKRALWDGEVPLRWIYSEIYQRMWFDILDSHKCDLISISKDELRIMTSFNSKGLTVMWKDPCNFYLTIVAKSDETISDPVMIHVVWDGKMADFDKMKDHLSINLETVKSRE